MLLTRDLGDVARQHRLNKKAVYVNSEYQNIRDVLGMVYKVYNLNGINLPFLLP